MAQYFNILLKINPLLLFFKVIPFLIPIVFYFILRFFSILLKSTVLTGASYVPVGNFLTMMYATHPPNAPPKNPKNGKYGKTFFNNSNLGNNRKFIINKNKNSNISHKTIVIIMNQVALCFLSCEITFTFEHKANKIQISNIASCHLLQTVLLIW
jgi:hypothetical protein